MDFDYIIVGAGSAGCALAARLSEDRNVRVLLLEAGGPGTRREIHIPAAFSKLFKTECDWAYQTEPQTHLQGRRLYWPRGKMLGGSSSLNAMIYIRGHRACYDLWRELGNEGWAWRDVFPFFLRAEHNQRGESDFHSARGPLWVSDLIARNPLSVCFVEACKEQGLPSNHDFNDAGQLGFGYYQVTQRRGRRWSAADAYLKPASARANLTVRTGAHATRVLVERGRAMGVEYLAGKSLHSVRAEREVILSGGTVNTPQLLLLSGIGPAGQLRALDIPVVADLPGVGENLHDHAAIGVCYRSRQAVSLATAESLPNFLRFLLFGRGPLTSNVAEAGGFLRTRPDLPIPDLQVHFGPVIYLDHGLTPPTEHGFTIAPTMVCPRSRGRLWLRTNDPLSSPAMDPNYLAEPEDLAVLADGVRLARSVAQARAFDRYRADELLPGAQVTADGDIRNFIRNRMETLYHPVGTCKMGPASDPLAVVDPQLRVRGIEGLRVADASIMPAIPNGNTNAPTIMIAEKAADLIRT